jgi:hypothetical protein
VQASVERKISDVGDRRTPGYRREWQEFFRPRSIDMVWIWEVFSLRISAGL